MLEHGAEAWVGFQLGDQENFKHAGLKDGEGGDGGAHFCLAGGFPQDGCARDVAALPDVAENAGSVKLLDAPGLMGDELGSEGFGWELVGEAAGGG